MVMHACVPWGRLNGSYQVPRFLGAVWAADAAYSADVAAPLAGPGARSRGEHNSYARGAVVPPGLPELNIHVDPCVPYAFPPRKGEADVVNAAGRAAGRPPGCAGPRGQFLLVGVSS